MGTRIRSENWAKLMCAFVFEQNLDYARQLLLRLEKESAGIKVQSKKSEVQAELVLKRDQIQTLGERLQELEMVCQASILAIHISWMRG
jgi:hypothetical protein